jgi:hypothetical protein
MFAPSSTTATAANPDLFNPTGKEDNGSGLAFNTNTNTSKKSSTMEGDGDKDPDFPIFVVPAVATCVLATSIIVICVAMRRKRRVASAVVVMIAIFTGGAVAQKLAWSRVPTDMQAIVEQQPVHVEAYLVVPSNWTVNLYVVASTLIDNDTPTLVAFTDKAIPPGAGETTSSVTKTDVDVQVPTGTAAGVEGTTGVEGTNRQLETVANDAVNALASSTDLTSIIVYSVSGVLMFLSALFAIGVWAWMRRPAEQEVVRLDTPLTTTPPLTSAKSSVSASSLRFQDALSIRGETEYSKAPSPRAPQLGYDAVPPQEYVPAPSANDVALTSSMDGSGYTRPPARYDSVDSATVSTSMPLTNSSSHYTRPGIDRRAFASGEIDFATPDEEDTSAPLVAPPAMRTVEWSSIVLGERIGAGSYGEVFNATLDGEVVAVKKLLNESGTREFERETKLMSVLPPHRNVLRVYAAAYDPPAIVSELCELGSLDQHQRLTQRKLLVVARDIADGMAHLHAHSIVHRDLAARNLLVNSKRVVKVADFGLARITNEDTYASTIDASAGPAKWMAPETIEKGKFSPAGDVWSFGVVLWELATGKRPFADMTAAAAAVAIAKGERLARPADISDEMWALMQSCWHTDPRQRPSMAQIVAQLAQMLTNVARHAA